MRRTGQLWNQILERSNLRWAVVRALRGKRDRSDARAFCARLDANLSRIATELDAESISLGRFHQFVIHDPKERIITAPVFEERVIHHALMNVCEPHFELRLIDDTFACRVGKGRDAAIGRALTFARRFPCFLTLDIRHYFDSISHDRLLAQVARLIKDERVVGLFDRIVRSFRGETGRGVPIGSLTSQHLANLYLGAFDRFVKERLRIRGYVRYMDDMAIWANSTQELTDVLSASREFLRDTLELEVKPSTPINHTRHGMDFLGCRVFATHVTLNRRSRVRFRRRLANLEREYGRGGVSDAKRQQRATALVAFARAAGVSSWRFRGRVLQEVLERDPRARTG